MARSASMHQRGFTLIEMSIVLVIIGLIIGGILKGQELIESSRQKNLISQIDRIRSGTTSFVDRFRSLPGDFSRGSVLNGGSLIGTGGDDNGIIGTIGTNVATTANFTANVNLTSENTKFFNQLIVANLAAAGTATQPGVVVACFAGLCATPSPLPSSAYPASGLTIGYGINEGSAANGNVADAKQTHWLIVSRFKATGAIAAGTTDGVLTPARAYQLDSKYDDGSAGAGNIRTSLIGTNCGSTTADYVTTDVNNLCNLMFTID